MSPRNPDPEEYQDIGMPDLPGDLFGEDHALYSPRARRATRPQRLSSDGEGHLPPRQERRRAVPEAIDEIFEERPHRRSDRRDADHLHDERPRRRPRPGVVEEFALQAPVQAQAERQREEGSGRALNVPRRTRREYGGEHEQPRSRSRRPAAPSRSDRVIQQPRMQAAASAADMVTSIRPARVERPVRPRRRRNSAWTWKPIVMPQPRQVLEQAFPNLLMAMTSIAILLLMPYMPFGLPLWAPLLIASMLGLYHFSNKQVHPMWARVAIVNLAIVGAFFPLVIVRQSVLRVPFVEWGNGTLAMPIFATIAVVVVMAALAVGSAVLCEEDPEYAGIIFLPAALMVPFFAGATEITSLATAFVVMAAIYVASAVLTVVASMLPGAYPTLVAPIALAFEFLVLPLSESTPIFPVGAGMSAKLLFFVVLFVSVGLTIAVPVVAVWTRQVRRWVMAGGSASRSLRTA